MSLNSLPAELTACIISHLAEPETTDPSPPATSKTTISHYASTCLKIKHAVEQRTFSSLRITSEDLPTFERLVTRCPSRRTLLRNLTFQPVLPAHSEKAYTRFERLADRRRNDEAFSASLERLFVALKPLDEVEGAAPLRLFLVPPYSPSDRAYTGKSFAGAGYDSRALGIKGDLYNARFAHSYLRLGIPPGFPSLNRVSQFVAAGNGPRYVAPGPLLYMLGKMPQVDDLTLQLYDNEKKKSGLRKQLRIDFGNALSSNPCSMLKRLRLDYLFDEPSDHRFVGKDMRVTCGKAMHDDFSLGLRRFISSCPVLEDVQLSGPICIDETLFQSPERGTSDVRWLCLKHFHVEISCFRPDGGWYLAEHPDFPRDEPCRQTARYTDSNSESDSIHSDAASDDATVEGIPSDEDENASADTYGRRERHREALRAGEAYVLCFRSEPTEALEFVWVAAA